MIRTFFSKSCFSRNRIFIGGNWKSNNTVEQSNSLVQSVVNKLQYNPKNMDVMVAPINLHLQNVQSALSKDSAVLVSAQNCSNYGFGAYTGEVSPKHLKDIGIDWVILGHSERRSHMKEPNDLVASKTKLALENKVKVVFCFGETLEGNL